MCGVTVMSQLVHAAGQAAGSTTQKPPSQTRGAVQSVVVVHASASLLRSTRHALPIHTPASASARTIAMKRGLMTLRLSSHHRPWTTTAAPVPCSTGTTVALVLRCS